MRFIHTRILGATNADGTPGKVWAFYVRKAEWARGLVVALGSYRFALVAG
jgi:hypothetical protein